MAEKKEDLTDKQLELRSNYTSQIRQKIQEIDKQIGTVLTIPQYSRHLRTFCDGKPKKYYEENKQHYMSVYEHLSKKYEVDPYIYRQQEDGFDEQRHVYPYSSGCAQCSHVPVYLDRKDPYRQNPPILYQEKCNQNSVKRWIEFTELNEFEVLREEIEEGYDAGIRKYVPRVRSQALMNIEDARRLMFLMQQPNFSYEDYIGMSPALMPREVDTHFPYPPYKLIQSIDELKLMLIDQQNKSGLLEAELNQMKSNNRNSEQESNHEEEEGPYSRVVGIEEKQPKYGTRKHKVKKVILEQKIDIYRKREHNVTKRRSDQERSDDSYVKVDDNGSNNYQSIAKVQSTNFLPLSNDSKVIKPPSQLEVQKMYNQDYGVKASQRDLRNLKTVTHQDPNYKSLAEIAEEDYLPSNELKLKSGITLQQNKQQSRVFDENQNYQSQMNSQVQPSQQYQSSKQFSQQNQQFQSTIGGRSTTDRYNN